MAVDICCPCAYDELDDCPHPSSCSCCVACAGTAKAMAAAKPKCPDHNLPPNIKGKCPRCARQLRKV